MKKLLALGIATALSAGSFSAVAGSMEVQLDLAGVDFVYDPAQTFNEIGTGSTIPLVDLDDDGFHDGDGTTSMTFAVLRDAGPMNDSKMADGTPGSDGKADATFGDLAFADPLGSITVKSKSPGSPTFDVTDQVYTDDPIAIDFRLVLETNTGITGPGSYDIIEEYSFFDILTRNGDPAWGLALDTDTNVEGVLVVADGGSSTIVFTALAGEIFTDPGSNNLPFGYVDPDEPIQFGFALNTLDSVPVWEQGVTGSGSGNVTFSIPEPGMLGLLGISLAGMGVLQRRRKQK